jgi:hypothetical protein
MGNGATGSNADRCFKGIVLVLVFEHECHRRLHLEILLKYIWSRIAMLLGLTLTLPLTRTLTQSPAKRVIITRLSGVPTATFFAVDSV